MTFIRGLLISVFAYIDKKIYWFVEKLYELFILISEAGVFSQSTIQEFSKRIYVFLGLIMIFQVTISLVNYIINPSTFDDKNIGGAALIKNAAISLVGIVLVPYVFEAAYGLQRIVLKENVIGNLILGVKTWDNQEEAESFVAYGGRKMAFSTFSSFITFNSEVASSSCINEPVLYPSYEFNDDACGKIGDIPFDSGVKDENGNELNTVGDYMEFAYKSGNVKNLANADLLNLEFKSTEGNYELFDYSYLISCAAGIFLIYILFKFCLDIAVRSVKLSFLQLIAPIPLMMRIDPRKGKQKFNKWVGECAKTFGDVFVRLAAIYFAIFIISAITTDGVQNISGSANNVQAILVKVGIIFGALMFAQQIPLLIGDIIGGGKETMQALSKTIGKATAAGTSMLGGAAIGAGLGLAGNVWAAGRKDYKTNKDANMNAFRAFGKSLWDNKGISSGLAGASSGMFNAAKAGTHAQKMSFGEMKKAGIKGMQVSRDNAIYRDLKQSNDDFKNKDGNYSWLKAKSYEMSNRTDEFLKNQNSDMTSNQREKNIKKLTEQYNDIRSDEVAARHQLSQLQNEYSSKYTRDEMNYAMSFYSAIDPNDDHEKITATRDDAYNNYHGIMSQYNPNSEMSREEFNRMYDAKETVVNKHREGLEKEIQIKKEKAMQDVNKSLQSNRGKPGDKK